MGDKMKKIILVISVLALVFMIYYVNLDDKVYFLSIGDYLTVGNSDANYQQVVEEYLKKQDLLEKNVNYSKSGDYRIIDLINDIEDNTSFNYQGEEYTLNNALIKADVITISIGMNDLLYNNLVNDDMYEYVDEVMEDMDELFELIREYSKEKIVVFNYYNLNNDKLVEYTNKRLETLANKYDIQVIDISDIKDYLYNSIYPSDNYYDNLGIKVTNYLKTIY